MIISKREFDMTCDYALLWDMLTHFDKQTFRSDIKDIKKEDDKHYYAYDHQNHKIEYIVVNKIHDDLFEYNMMSHEFEGHMIIKLKDNREHIHISMTQAIELKKNRLFMKSTIERKLDQFISELKQNTEY